MSTETSQQTIESQLTSDYSQLSQWVKETGSVAGNFLNEQTPLFVQEYLNYVFWSSSFKCVLLAVLITVISVIFYKIVSWGIREGKKDHWDNPAYIFAPLISGLVLAFGFTISFCNFYSESSNLIKMKVAPRVLIVEKVGQLIK